MKKILTVILTALLILSVLPLAAACGNDAADENQPLKFLDGSFKILQLTDFHEWAAIESPFEQKDTLKPLLESFINDMLDAENPDLVVLTGDNVFPLSSKYDRSPGIAKNTYRLFAELFEEREQFWTMTFGNHDSESYSNKIDFLNEVRVFPHYIGGDYNTDFYSSFEFNRKDENKYADERLCNYSIPIYENGKVKFNVYLLDSGSFNMTAPAIYPYRYILDEQTDWYKEQAEALKTKNSGNPVPSLLFTHIPLLEHEEAYNAGGDAIGEWTGISPSEIRSSIFEAAFEMRDVLGIFTGHNHYNSYTGFYTRGDHKIMLGVTPQAAADSYSATTGVLRCRVFDITSDGNFSTYIRTSDTDTYPSGIFRDETLAYASDQT